MLKNLCNIKRGILIYDLSETSKLASFVYRIKPNENRGMMSEKDIQNEITKLEHFFKVNKNFTISTIKIKCELTDYDYLDKYLDLEKKLKLDVGNKTLQTGLIYGNAKLIQSKTRGTFKHEYYVKISSEIKNIENDKELMAKAQELSKLLSFFPYIDEMLTDLELILLLARENRFYNEELITLSESQLKKQGIIK